MILSYNFVTTLYQSSTMQKVYFKLFIISHKVERERERERERETSDKQ